MCFFLFSYFRFGRFTVAALQAKVDQYEREMSRLKKALERSDQYIEELEAQIVPLKRPPEDKKIEKSQCGNTALTEEHAGIAATSHVCQDISTAKLFPEHSNDSDGIYSDDIKGLCPTSATLKQTQSKTVSSPKLKNGLHSVWNGEEQISLAKDSPSKGIVSLSQDLGSPSSSLSFSSLQLNTPDRKANSFKNTNLKKPLTYLRKLVFDDLPQRRERGKLDPACSEHYANGADGATQPGQSTVIFSNFCHINGDPQDKNLKKTDRTQDRNGADQIVSKLHTISGENFSKPGTLLENSVNINLNGDNNAVSHLESQNKHTSVPHLTPDWVRHFQSDSPVHIYKSSEETTLSHGESSKQAKSFTVCSSLSSSIPDNEEQAHLFMTQPSDRYDIDFSNQSCVSLQPEEEDGHQADSKVFLTEHISELGYLYSLPQIYSGSPPAKRKLLNPCNNSPSKSSKH